MSSAPAPAAPRPGIHPRHPGIGCSTSLIRLEGDDPEVGGLIVFFPSGRHLDLSWRAVQHITPTKEAALQYTGKLVEILNQASGQGDTSADEDLRRTNWVSVTAAVQRIILDFNSKLSAAVSAKMAAEFDPAWPPKHKPKPH